MEIGDIQYVVKKTEVIGRDRGVLVTVVRKKRIATPSLVQKAAVLRCDVWEVLVEQPCWLERLFGVSIDDKVHKAEKKARKVVWKLEKSDYEIRLAAEVGEM